MKPKIFFVVEGLFEKSDSIGFDCVYEYLALRDYFVSKADVKLYAKKFDNDRYPDAAILDIQELYKSAETADAIIIYHYCDGWPEFEDFISSRNSPTIVRWHNNTPPWFFAKYSRRSVERTVKGFKSIMDIGRKTNCSFWCNSAFTVRQLGVLGVDTSRADVVYPASKFLDLKADDKSLALDQNIGPNSKTKILFVSRLVAHKGHKAIIVVAAYVKAYLKSDVEVIFPGRSDPSADMYLTDLKNLAESFGVKINIPGEIDNDQLQSMYLDATCLLCLSEHEGFGLPIYEAMKLRVPVVAWSNTALEEMLVGHPLCSDISDLRWFAAGVISAIDEKIRQIVIDLQLRHILPQYTKAVVLNQMLLGLKKIPTLFDLDTSIIEGQVQQKLVTEDAISEVKSYVSEVYTELEHFHIDTAINREIKHNFVTKYDIETYEILLDEDLGFLSPKGDIGQHSPPQNTNNGAMLNFTRFSSFGGRIQPDGIIVQIHSIPNHLIFGPYIKLPKGFFTSKFLFSLVDATEGILYFDIINGKDEVLSEITVRFEQTSSTDFEVQLEFENIDSNSTIEFRVRSEWFSNGSMNFRGVNVIRAPSFDEMLAMSKTFDPFEFIKPKSSSLPSMPRSKSQLQESERMFRQADLHLDQKHWREATVLLAKGLNLDPTNSRRHLTHGKTLQEAGYLLEAEEAFKAAISSKPNFAEAYLELGHLYARHGKKRSALTCFYVAVLLEESGYHAAKEIARMGFSDDMLKFSLETVVRRREI